MTLGVAGTRLPHVQVAERAEETLRLDRWSTGGGVVRTEGTPTDCNALIGKR